MSIATLDQLLAAMPGQAERILKTLGSAEAAGEYFSTFLSAGRPGAGTAPSVGLNGETVSNSTSGVLPYTNASSGYQNYLARFAAFSAQAGSVILYDRLWQNSGIVVTTTTAQLITFSGLPSRDGNGAALGEDVELWLEVYTATTNGSAITNTTVSYTNQSGTAGRTGTITSFPATAVAGTMVPIRLQAGDTGVRSVQSITLGTSYGGGAIGLVCLRHLAAVPILSANTGEVQDAFKLGMPKLYDGSALCLMALAASTTVGPFDCSLNIVQG